MKFALAIALLLCPRWAHADVADSSAAGFTIKISIPIAAQPADAYRNLIRNVGDWWDSNHTFSGDAHNLSIEEKSMGCFCEKLPGGGAVRHLELVNFSPGQTLVFSGALGPLQSLAATGTMTIHFAPADAGTKLTVVYSVLGYQPAGMAAWAAPVDTMLTEQFTRLKNYAEHAVTQGKVYKFEKEAEGVYYATGGLGSNNVVIVNDDDVLLVDDGTTPATARALVEDIKLLTPKPIRTVVNTHFHYDHTDGNSIFGPNIEIIAHEYVRTAIQTLDVLHREPYLTSQLRLSAAEREQLKEVKPTPPTRTYTSQLVLHKGRREIQLLFLGRGHTAGDTFVYLPQDHIICTGDMEEGARVAYMGDAYPDEWIATLEKLKQLDFTRVLPGHGVPFDDKSIITAFQSYLTDITAQVASLRKQGVSADDAAKRLDLTAHKKDFPEIALGAEPRGVRRIYEWMQEREKH